MKQPYPMPPGDTLDFTWPFASLIPAGDSAVSHVVTPGEFLTVPEDGLATSSVTAFVTLDPLTPLGTETEVSATITTASTPPRVITRTIRIQAARRGA